MSHVHPKPLRQWVTRHRDGLRGLGMPAGKDYSASGSVRTPVVPCVAEHHRQPDRIRPIRIWRVTSRTRRRPGAKWPKVAVATYTAVLVAVPDNSPLLGP